MGKMGKLEDGSRHMLVGVKARFRSEMIAMEMLLASCPTR
jgi:hypothetical protein